MRLRGDYMRDKMSVKEASPDNKRGRGFCRGVYLLTVTGLLSAVALVLSMLENMLPDFPFVIPGMKLGLSNIALMFSLELCPLPCSVAIVIIKALFAFITRGATAGLLSVSGGLASALIMCLLMRSERVSFGCLGIGISGAFMHNMGQLLAAFALVRDSVKAYFPILSAVSILTGTLTALVYYILMPMLARIPQISQKN